MRMVIVSSGRQTGKTTTLIEQVKEGVQRADGSWSRIMLVATEREAERLRREFHLNPRQVYSAQTWARDRVTYHQPPSDLYLDNLEDWLYSQLGQVPSMVSTSVPVHVAETPAPAFAPVVHEPQACPECLQDKHGNCDGSTWDAALDQPGLCPCYKAGHG